MRWQKRKAQAPACSRWSHDQVFVPLDVSEADAAEYAADLEGDAERWSGLKTELALIASGVGVQRIIGDQRRTAEFHFRVRPLRRRRSPVVAGGTATGHESGAE